MSVRSFLSAFLAVVVVTAAIENGKGSGSLRIANGAPSSLEFLPFPVAIFVGTERRCSGVVASTTAVLTTASCVSGQSLTEMSVWWYNVTKSLSPSYTVNSTYSHPVASVTPHPQYNAGTGVNNLALVYPTWRIPITSTYPQAATFALGDISKLAKVGDWINVVGYGTNTTYETPLSNTSAYMFPETAQGLTMNLTRMSVSADAPNFVLLGRGANGSRGDACFADDGAGASVSQDGLHFVAGIYQGGTSCGYTEKEFLNVTYSATWLRDGAGTVLDSPVGTVSVLPSDIGVFAAVCCSTSNANCTCAQMQANLRLTSLGDACVEMACQTSGTRQLNVSRIRQEGDRSTDQWASSAAFCVAAQGVVSSNSGCIAMHWNRTSESVSSWGTMCESCRASSPPPPPLAPGVQPAPPPSPGMLAIDGAVGECGQNCTFTKASVPGFANASITCATSSVFCLRRREGSQDGVAAGRGLPPAMERALAKDGWDAMMRTSELGAVGMSHSRQTLSTVPVVSLTGCNTSECCVAAFETVGCTHNIRLTLCRCMDVVMECSVSCGNSSNKSLYGLLALLIIPICIGAVLCAAVLYLCMKKRKERGAAGATNQDAQFDQFEQPAFVEAQPAETGYTPGADVNVMADPYGMPPEPTQPGV
eukprot:TRINITY_DN45244_c0_g1_i1.p1 TRINITY_DN45244_c0_g1~~TRINITY_DN45244_c0_g1_i1.p1  ORF type:complete len:648 (-),score=71.70 TRINITY_DN45244_c0_g1_i1:158-2101(-)